MGTAEPVTKEKCGESGNVIHCLIFILLSFHVESAVSGTDRKFHTHYYLNKYFTVDVLIYYTKVTEELDFSFVL